MSARVLFALAGMADSSYRAIQIQAGTGNVTFGPHILKDQQVPDLYCNAAYNSMGTSSFTVQHNTTLSVVDATSGSVTSTSQLEQEPNWSGSAYTSDGTLYALGYPATIDGQQSLWRVDASTGAVHVVSSGFKVYNGLLSCVFTVVGGATPNTGAAYWLSNFPGFNTIVSTADLSSGSVSGVLYRGDGALLSLLAVPNRTAAQAQQQAQPQAAAGSTMLLGLDIKGERGPLLVAINPSTGVPAVLYTFPLQDLDDDEGSLAYDEATGLAYVLMAVTNSSSGVTSRSLCAVNVTSSPPALLSTVPLDLPDPATVVGVFGLSLRAP